LLDDYKFIKFANIITAMLMKANIYEIEVTVKQEKDISQERKNSYSCLSENVKDALSMIEMPENADYFTISVTRTSKDSQIYISPGIAKLIREGEKK